MTPRIILVDDYEQLIEAAWTIREDLFETRRRYDELGIMTDLTSGCLEDLVASVNYVYLRAMQSRRDLLNNSDEGVDHEHRVDSLRRILIAAAPLDAAPSTT